MLAGPSLDDPAARTSRIEAALRRKRAAGGVMRGARVEPTAAPKLCRQSAVVGECRIEARHEVAGLVSHQRSYAAAPLALHDQASAAEHDLAPSARLPDRLAGHE